MWQGTECPPVHDEDDEDQGEDDDYGNKLGQNIIRRGSWWEFASKS